MDEESGLVFTSSFVTNNPVEILALDEAKKFGASAVYFRRFPDSDLSVPQVYIYERDFSDDDIVDTHRKLWSSGVVPLFYIVTDTQVKIFSCTKKASENSKNHKLIISPLDTIVLATSLQKSLEYHKYSARLFDNGTFWEQERNKELLDIKNTPYEILLDGLIRARKRLEQQREEIGISDSTISKLLIMGVLVKYLEEKQDANGHKLLEIYRDFYNQFPNSVEFTDILRNRQCVAFLEKLSGKFNGKIFYLNDSEKAEISSANLNYVADFFDSTLARGIRTLKFINWKLYSFNYLPIELISGLYEAFLNNKRSDIVYTPPFLVNFLIDECMPIQKANEYFKDEIFKVLDPSCGSGIFLVSALKRMVQWKAVLNYQKTGKIEYPDVETIKQIIRNNIFGVDIEHEATLITIFSLSIALCDKLTPMQIWDDLRFDDLSQTNIQKDNFFGFFNTVEKASFDLVIGNPPFNPPEKVKNSEYYAQLKKDYQTESSFPIQDQNLALLFWDRAVLLCKPKRDICLILPSGTWLYNNNTLDYRAHFLQSFDVNKIIDFTHLSDTLFHGSANVAVCAVKAINQLPSKDNLLHVTVKRTNVSEKRKFFELDHYDYHTVNYETALNNSFVWKANLLGGKRLLRLIDRLSKLPILRSFLISKRKKGWDFGEGYIIGHDGAKSHAELIERDYKYAEWITNKSTVVSDDFNEKGIQKIEIESETIFQWPRMKTKKIFSPPHILIKENLGKENIPIAFVDEYLCFQNEVVGIHAPEEDYGALLGLYRTFLKQNRTYRFYLLSISSRAGINKSNSPLYMKDIMELPYPEDKTDLELSKSEEIVRDDVLSYYIKSNQGSNNSPLNQTSKSNAISEYAEIFCNTLNPIYANEKMRWELDGIAEIEETLSVVIFRYGSTRATPVIDTSQLSFKMLSQLVYKQHGSNVRITRVFRAYLHQDGYDLLVLVKPNLMRYWLKFISLRDADETFADLKRAGF